MDYIQKAIRDGEDGSEKVISADENNLQNIEYSRTRSVAVSAETLSKHRVITPDFHDKAVIDAYKVVRTRVLQHLQQNNWNTIAITSPGEREGKTLTAVNLSIALAMTLDYTVLLVDLDTQHPSVHECLGFSPDFGLSDYFESAVPLEKILVKPEIPGIEHLVVIPERSDSVCSSEILSSHRMASLVKEIKSRYPQRLIIFDLPPALAGDDVLGFSSYAEATVIVAEEGKTRSKDLARVASILQNTQVIGSVLNKSSDTSYRGSNTS